MAVVNHLMEHEVVQVVGLGKKQPTIERGYAYRFRVRLVVELGIIHRDME
jgi:hypothetical protein